MKAATKSMFRIIVVFPAKERPRARLHLSQIAFFDGAGGLTKCAFERLGKRLHIEVTETNGSFKNVAALHQL
jgi:hypothetical protein